MSIPLILALALVTPLVLVVALQHRLIYHRRRYPGEELSHAVGGIVPLRYRSHGSKQCSWFIPAASGRAGCIWVIFGGNASLALRWQDFAGAFGDPAAAFLLFEYPGYGTCGGRPSPSRIDAAADAAWDALGTHVGRTGDLESVPLHVLGHSLGAAAGLRFAARHAGRSVVMISPFTSMRDMATHTVGSLLAGFALHRFDNKDLLREWLHGDASVRVTIIHGDADDIIPVRMGRELAALDPRIRYFELAGGDHNGILESARDIIHQAMRDNAA